MAAHLTRRDCEGLSQVLYTQIQWIRTDGDMLWNESEDDGYVIEREEDKGTHCEVGDSDTDW
jgi:hypothetical protein